MNNTNKVSYKDYRSTYLNFASKYAIEGPISLDALNTVIYYMNSEYLDNDTFSRISDSNYVCEESTSTDYIQKSINEIKSYNINSYYKGENPILLSDAIIRSDQKQVLNYIEKLIKNIRELPQEEAIDSYIKLKDIIMHKSLEGYDLLNSKQQRFIEEINIPVANNLVDYRKDAKQYKITQ